MAYLSFSTQGKEWDRREITGPVVLGRAPDCDISIHDILLSRRHCRLTPIGGKWLVIDLSSRNGTAVGDQRIEERRLKSGDVIRIGKTRITFRDEPFVPPHHRPSRPALPPTINRADDTVAGTIFDLEFDPVPEPIARPGKPPRPVPRPRPKDPESFETDDLYSMLEQIASSSWDSIYAVNAQPLRKDRLIPQPKIAGQSKPRPMRPTVSMALQAGVLVGPKIENHGSRIAPSSTASASSNDRSAVSNVRRRIIRLGRWITRVGALRLF